MAGFLKGNKVELGDGVNAGDVPRSAPSRTRPTRRRGSPTRRASRRIASQWFPAARTVPSAPNQNRLLTTANARGTTRGGGDEVEVWRRRSTLRLVAALLPSASPAVRPRSRHRLEPPRGAADRRGPVADNTDVYPFVSPDRPDTVTILANYIPLEEPAGGPNFNGFDDNVLYEIKIDNDGDGKEDISYQFRFRTRPREPEHVPLQHGPDRHARDPDWNRPPVLQRHAGGPGSLRGRPWLAENLRRRPSTSARARRRTTTRSPRGSQRPPGRRQGLRRPDRRSVLRRPRLGLRPGRPAAVQPHLIPLPAPPTASTGRRLQHAHDRAPGADRAADQGPAIPNTNDPAARRLRDRRAGSASRSRPGTARATRRGASCRSRGSPTRSSTRS